jgi:hypothetical protein
MSTFGEDILTTAVEGGIGYWSIITSAKRLEDLTWVEVKIKGTPETEDDFDPMIVKATQLEKVARELAKGGRIRSDLTDQIKEALKYRDAGYIDADAADCVVQFAAFGELVYG